MINLVDRCNDPSYLARRLPGVPNLIQILTNHLDRTSSFNKFEQPGNSPPDRTEELARLPVIVSDTSITLGQILDETKKQREEHRYCPNAHQGLHRDDGTVNTGVRFEAILKLSSDDPLSKERKQAEETMRREEPKMPVCKLISQRSNQVREKNLTVLRALQ